MCKVVESAPRFNFRFDFTQYAFGINNRSGPLPNSENVSDGARLFDGYAGYGENIIVTRQGTMVNFWTMCILMFPIIII
jgi:hypothetical protein